MAEGTIDVVPEILDHATALLPRGVSIVSTVPYGGAMRLTIRGSEIEDGKAYQLVVTDEPMRRAIMLVKNPGQDV